MIKIVVLGAGGVGKTSLVRYILAEKEYQFLDHYQPTVYDVHQKEVICDQGSFLFEITDMAGQYSFPAMRKLAITRSDLFMLVYNVADKKTLEAARRIKDEICSIKDQTSSRITLILVGNKMDLTKSDSDCPECDADAEVDDWCFSRLVTSAKTGYNMERLFETIIEESEACSMKQVKVKKTFSFETLFKRSDNASTQAQSATAGNFLKP